MLLLWFNWSKIISEGISSKTKQKVKQTHFAFRDENGGDSHKVFCDHYSGEDKQSTATNEVLIDLLKNLKVKSLC